MIAIYRKHAHIKIRLSEWDRSFYIVSDYHIGGVRVLNFQGKQSYFEDICDSGVTASEVDYICTFWIFNRFVKKKNNKKYSNKQNTENKINVICNSISANKQRKYANNNCM